MLTASKI